jgi:hypothetical protein
VYGLRAFRGIAWKASRLDLRESGLGRVVQGIELPLSQLYELNVTMVAEADLPDDLAFVHPFKPIDLATSRSP